MTKETKANDKMEKIKHPENLTDVTRFGKGGDVDDSRVIFTSHIGVRPEILLPPHPPPSEKVTNSDPLHESQPHKNKKLSTSLHKSCNVQVAVRVRPLTATEEASLSGRDTNGGSIISKARSAVSVQPQMHSVSIGERRFTYDFAFDERITQDQIYEDTVKNMLPGVLNGYNATVLAYGQTGSGKTYTMGSEHGRMAWTDESRGIIPRFLTDLFCGLENLEKSRSHLSDNGGTIMEHKPYSVSASFLEVYGEDIHDLLEEDRRSLPLREDSNGVSAAGLTKVPILNVEEALNVLKIGSLHRTTASTLMNMSSSRSHAVFSIRVSQFFEGNGDNDNATTSQIVFVDLAGSERVKKTGAEGQRMREGIRINVGLLALGNVINALADEERLAKGEKVHVPYRQSKLTRLLQDALGGNSQTLFLACVSPAGTNASESLSTLKYANRARNIKNKPTKNVDQSVLLIQHLRLMNSIFQCELVKHRFGDPPLQEISSKEEEKLKDNPNSIGLVSNELLQRKEVQEYIQLLHNEAKKQHSSEIENNISLCETHPVIPRNITFEKNYESSSNENGFSQPNEEIVKKNIDTNPDDDIAILDQLLQLHSSVENKDEEYKACRTRELEELKEVEGEIEEKENLWQKLREKMNDYHQMKVDYEKLVLELQNLEREKAELAAQLECVQNDPTKGCSKSIKLKLEKIELNLSRARSETRKHQELYRKTELEAKKCRTLEIKINDLKRNKVSLVQKQREAAQRYREFTENKQREILLLKKNERKVGKQFSLLETECRKQKIALERRNNYCSKLSEKLKQTESHLMKVLSLRKKDLQSRSKNYRGIRASSKHGSSRRMSSSRPFDVLVSASCESDNDNIAFAPISDEVTSLKFLIDKIVRERVDEDILRQNLDDRVNEYSCVMRSLRDEIAQINILKVEQYDSGNQQVCNDELNERKQNIEDLELKLELISADIEELQLHESLNQEHENDQKEKEEMQIVSNLSAPISRTLLWELLEDFTSSEINRKKAEEALRRKDVALQNYETDLENSEKNLEIFRVKYEKQNQLLTENRSASVEIVDCFQDEVLYLKNELEKVKGEKEQLTSNLTTLKSQLTVAERDLLEMQESAALLKASKENINTSEEAKQSLSELQMTWKILGVSNEERNCVRRQIETSLVDTCRLKLEAAATTFSQTLNNITKLRKCSIAIHHSLGIPEEDNKIDSDMFKDSTMLDHFEQLKNHWLQLKPKFDSARERLLKVAKDASSLVQALDVDITSLSPQLQLIISQNIETVEEKSIYGWNEINIDDIGPPNSLSTEIISQCEKDAQQLRLLKSQILATNSLCREKAYNFALSTNFHRKDLFALCVNTLKKRGTEFPGWWDPMIADQICGSITRKNAVVNVDSKYTKHLLLACESLEWIESGRHILSDSLKDIIKNAYTIMLSAVEGQADASEAFATFNDAFSQLPQFSKDYIRACIDEMKTIVKTAEDMLQSETEGLTLVWEALKITSSQRGQFWGEVDEALNKIEMATSSPFDALLQNRSLDLEEWVAEAAQEASKIKRKMDILLSKLEKIHSEIQCCREKQIFENKIQALDAEIQVMGVQLKQFEEEAGNKQRLLRGNSINLLKEERFRKLMQSKLAPKLELLGNLLLNWEKTGGAKFDINSLSNEVRLFMDGHKSVEKWVENRTAFMHLKTTMTKIKAGHESKFSQIKVSKCEDKNYVSPRHMDEKEKTSPYSMCKAKRTHKKTSPTGMKTPGYKQKIDWHKSTKKVSRSNIRSNSCASKSKVNSIRKVSRKVITNFNEPSPNERSMSSEGVVLSATPKAKENLSPFGALLATTPK